MFFGVRKGVRDGGAFLLRGEKVYLSRSKTVFFKMGKGKIRDKLNTKLRREKENFTLCNHAG